MGKSAGRLAAIAIFAVVYFVSGKCALTLAFLHPSATPVWPNSGIALAALLIFGLRLWPGIFIGAFLVNLTTAGTLETSLAIAAGNTLEALAGAWLVQRFAGAEDALLRTVDILKFSLLAGLLSTTFAATIGVFSLAVEGFASWQAFWTVWLTWWLGDAAGILMVAPVILVWRSRRGNPWKWSQVRLEAIALLVATVLVGQLVFSGMFAIGKNYALEYFCLPIIVWAAFRFGQRESLVTMLVFSASAIWGTLGGFGPFGRDTLNESLVLLQAFLSVGAVVTMVLSTEVTERRRAEAEARLLAVSDALTGLGNYRKLIEVFNAELRRCAEDSAARFSVLLFDLDGLKQVNDTYGHLVGSRALCRFGNVLRRNCAPGDTATRYGGDEFAVVLPDMDYEHAVTLSRNIQADLLADPEHPGLSVSAGVSQCPQDGMSIEELMRKADEALYRVKDVRNGRSRTTSIRAHGLTAP